MRKVKVLFFAADPLSTSPDGRSPQLKLQDDVRKTRQKVRMAEHRDAIDFDPRLAARPDDLMQALYETRPAVVHFSGHGKTEGLVLVGPDGELPHLVEGEALVQLFQAFRGDIRVVVLNACFSQQQAKAIAEVVGCAIGTRRAISDAAAITFGSSFYRAIAFGQSVQEAFDQACTALALEHFHERDCPALEKRDDVDPSQLVLIPPEDVDEEVELPLPRRPSRNTAWVAVAGTTLVLASVAVIARVGFGGSGTRPEFPPDCAPITKVRPLAALESPVAPSTTPGDPAGSAEDIEAARDLYQAGNYAAAFRIFKRAAAARNAEAIGFLGIMHLYGQGTVQNQKLGIDLLRKAGGERDARAMNALADAYRKGVGVTASDRWANHWYEAAAEIGDAEAMRELGTIYREGRGVPRSDSLALDWYVKAMRAGSAEAMVDLAKMHDDGRGTPASARKALRCYQSAAESGSLPGMLAMGQIFEKGADVRQDYAQAAEWYRKAADAGSADGMNNLGVLYLNGLGVQQDSAAALDLFRRAAAGGSSVAKGNLELLERTDT